MNMTQQPLISICIPAYKNEVYLKRLLESILIQTFQDFEVIVSDDSPDTLLADIISLYNNYFKIHYVRNERPLGSPANWNHAIRLAKGKWIKIMHDDDWFTDESSLEQYATIALHTKADFIFSGFYEVELNSGKKKSSVISIHHLHNLRKNPLYLFRTNYIGHPSTTLIRNIDHDWFDEQIKWVVDFEFYIRFLRSGIAPEVIRKPLVCIGVGEEQITKAVFRNPKVEIPENIYLLNKLGVTACRNIYVYDYCWRLIRNLGIRQEKELWAHLHNAKELPKVIISMIRAQRWFSLSLLKIGLFSKSWMFLNWLLYNLSFIFLISATDKKEL
jgi:glycosyltransferase involved in cell wall biosynthesis